MNYSVDQDPNRSLTLVLYILYILAIFTVGLLAIVALIVNYIKRDAVKGSIFESHFTWQIRTFWWSLLWTIIGCVLSIILIGFVVLGINAIWVIYRLAKGWINLNDAKPMTL